MRIGIGGPVGSGKTMLVLRLCQWLRGEFSIAVVTNDIYTREDAEFLVRNDALPAERVIGVETGGCPHTAIRDDTSMNLAAIAELERRHPDVQLILVESGGDNLSATFSPELVEAFIYVIDVAEGDKIPRKGGPAIRHSDLLLINKTDLAPHVGADLEVMARDCEADARRRGRFSSPICARKRARTSCWRGCGARCCSCERESAEACAGLHAASRDSRLRGGRARDAAYLRSQSFLRADASQQAARR